ncbi:MAG: hypothetical protein GXP23_10590 [Gammaproteobacteria bacterium]|nr:hypothetical protein [Gammaproteobacteria bacterium]
MDKTIERRWKTPAAKPVISETGLQSLMPEIEQIIRSGRFILGPKMHQFEEVFRQYVGTAHAVAVGTCSAALQIVL